MMQHKWYEDDRFWDEFHNLLFSDDRWKKAPEEVEAVLKLAMIRKKGAVLDLCCGPGRHSISFAKKGFKVTGVDRNEQYLKEAKQRATKAKLKIEFVQNDMRKFIRPNSFDLAISLYTSFGYFSDKNDDKKVAKHVYSSLHKGGMFVMDLMGKEILARIFREHDWNEYADGSLMLEHRQVEDNWSWIKNRWMLIKNGKIYSCTIEHRLYSGSELYSLLEEAGFSNIEIFGDITGAPYDHNARRLIAVAKK